MWLWYIYIYACIFVNMSVLALILISYCMRCYHIISHVLCRQSDIIEENAGSLSKPPQRKRKERSPTSVDDVQEQFSPENLPTEGTNKGGFDIPIAERLKLRRDKMRKGDDAVEGAMSTMEPCINTRTRKSKVLDSGLNENGKGNDIGGNAKMHRSTPKQNGEMPPGVYQASFGKWVSCCVLYIYYIYYLCNSYSFSIIPSLHI